MRKITFFRFNVMLFARKVLPCGLFVLLSLVLLITPSHVTANDILPRVVGVTEGSVYKHFVQIYFYPREAMATLSKDGGPAQQINFGHFIEPDSGNPGGGNGEYRLQAWLVGSDTGKRTVNFTFDHLASEPVFRTNSGSAGALLQIRFMNGEYARNGGAIPVYAIWAEDLKGNFIQNLYVSNYVATNYPKKKNTKKWRKALLPFWMHKTGSQVGPNNGYYADPENNVPPDLDVVSGATCKTDYTVAARIKPNPGDNNRVKVFFEIQQAWDYNWYFNTQNTTGEASLIYVAEIDLTGTLTYNLGGTEHDLFPAGYGHPTGDNGVFHTDFYKVDPATGRTRYIFTEAPEMTRSLTLTVEEPVSQNIVPSTPGEAKIVKIR